MAFPVHALKPRGGELWAVLFENPSARVALDVYWSAEIRFGPFDHYGEELGCLLSADWMRIPVRDWRDLSGRVVEGPFDVVQTSFYTVEHDPAVSSRIAFGPRVGAVFDVQWSATIRFEEFHERDADPGLKVHAAAALPFSGILIPTDAVRGTDMTDARAEELLDGLIDRDRFGRLEHSRNSFGVEQWRLLPE